MSMRILAFLFCLLALALNGYAGNILVNPGFETGVLSPWFNSNDFCGGCTWAVTAADAHTGGFSAEVSGNRLLEQDFAAVPTSMITEVSLWLRMPETGIAAVYFLYSDASTEENTVSPGEGWAKFDMTAFLDPGKSLAGFGVYGCSGCAGASITRADDFVVDTAAGVPEPSTWLLLGSAGAGLGLLKLRRNQ
jgi:hypothetical protein